MKSSFRLFLIDLLLTKDQQMVSWIDMNDQTFRVNKPHRLAKSWGIYKRGISMKWSSVSKIFRLYRDEGISDTLGKRQYRLLTNFKREFGYEVTEITRIMNKRA